MSGASPGRASRAMPVPGPWSHLEVALLSPRRLTEGKEQDPIPAGMHTSSIPKIRGCAKQPHVESL